MLQGFDLGCGMGVIVIWECDSGRVRPRAKVRAGAEGTEGTDIGVCSGAAVVANSVVCFGARIRSSEAAVVEVGVNIGRGRRRGRRRRGRRLNWALLLDLGVGEFGHGGALDPDRNVGLVVGVVVLRRGYIAPRLVPVGGHGEPVVPIRRVSDVDPLTVELGLVLVGAARGDSHVNAAKPHKATLRVRRLRSEGVTNFAPLRLEPIMVRVGFTAVGVAIHHAPICDRGVMM
eukprot:scaffold26606_cov50-Phaeocystis_antarctica.AAC.3